MGVPILIKFDKTVEHTVSMIAYFFTKNQPRSGQNRNEILYNPPQGLQGMCAEW